MSTCVLTGGDQGVCAGVISLCQRHNIHCAFFLPHDDDRGDRSRLVVGFVPHLMYPHLVVLGEYPVVAGRCLEGDSLKHGRVVCEPETHDESITTLCRELCPDYDQMPTPVRHALRRDAQMVTEADAVYLLGHLIRPSSYSMEPMGGQGWIHHMTLRQHKPLYFYDLSINTWLRFDYTRLQFAPWFGGLPSLANQHSLVAGTRRLTKHDPAFFDILQELLLSAQQA